MSEREALCIGINDYPGTDSDLSGCVNDSQDWRDVLVSKEFRVKTLFDKQATRVNILSNLKYLVTMAIPGDTVVFQYSGHGTQVPDNNSEEADKLDEALCPYDIWTNGPVLDDEIWKILRSKQPAVKIIFISDSCHSGSVVRAFGMPHVGKKKFIHYSKFMSQATTDWALASANKPEKVMFDEKVPWPCLLLAGCQDNEYSYDASFKGRANGAFTYWALQALKKLPKTATYTDWYNIIRKMLPSKDYPQMPNILGSYQGNQIF